MLKIYKTEVDKIKAQALKELPAECCGLLGGINDGEDIIIKEARALENLDKSHEHFTMDPKEQFQTVKEFREKGYFMAGNYHSHPETPSRMSEEDKRLAFDTNAIYAIVSTMDKNDLVLNFFKIDKDKNITKLDYLVIE